MRLSLLSAAIPLVALFFQGCSSNECQSDSDCVSPKICRSRRCGDLMIVTPPLLDGGFADAKPTFPDALPIDTGSSTTADGGTVGDAGTSSTSDGGMVTTDGGMGNNDGGTAMMDGSTGAYLHGEIWVREVQLPVGLPIQSIQGHFSRRSAAPTTSPTAGCVLQNWTNSTQTAGIGGEGIDLENLNVPGAAANNPDLTLSDGATVGLFEAPALAPMGSFWALGGGNDVQYSVHQALMNGDLDQVATQLAIVPSDFSVAAPTNTTPISLAATNITFTWNPHFPATVPMMLELADATRTIILTCTFSDTGMFVLPDMAKTDFLAAGPTDPVVLDIGYERDLAWPIPLRGTAEMVNATIRHSKFVRFNTSQ
ncbi:MAG: hypothetical protein U1E65_29915 [Myxococcota bacterium]